MPRHDEMKLQEIAQAALSAVERLMLEARPAAAREALSMYKAVRDLLAESDVDPGS